MTELSAQIGFFGKLPSRGDFVKTADQHALMDLLDRWIGQGLELLSQGADWKQSYDTASPLHFVLLGSRSRPVIAGHLLPSTDAAGRRFPFLAAIRLEVAAPLEFMARSPLVFTRLWATLARAGREANAATDAGDTLRKLAETRIALNTTAAGHDAPFFDFLDTQELGSAEEALRNAGHSQVELRLLLPALGVMLQPANKGGAPHIDKNLSLPLPSDPLYRALFAAFWLDLIAAFLTRSDLEVAVLIQHGPSPRMIVGFNGTDGNALHSALDAIAAREKSIDIDCPEWVEDVLEEQPSLARLSSYLEHDDLSLRSAREVFRSTFLGG